MNIQKQNTNWKYIIEITKDELDDMIRECKDYKVSGRYELWNSANYKFYTKLVSIKLESMGLKNTGENYTKMCNELGIKLEEVDD